MRHDTANKETCCYEAGAAKFACLEYTRTHAHSNPCKGSTGMSCMLAVAYVAGESQHWTVRCAIHYAH